MPENDSETQGGLRLAALAGAMAVGRSVGAGPPPEPEPPGPEAGRRIVVQTGYFAACGRAGASILAARGVDDGRHDEGVPT